MDSFIHSTTVPESYRTARPADSQEAARPGLPRSKRLMILATALPLPAAIDRIAWLPKSIPLSPVAPDLYIILQILPLLASDLVRQKTMPRACMCWFAGLLPTSVIINLLWSSPWWLAAAPKLMGVESW
ncbi:MAG: hypothetical protein R3F50_13225 [Gammaproteobacteria bacterium]